jgi:hypothetical protein
MCTIKYGFNFQTLYYLKLETLYEICQFIRGNDSTIAPDYDVIVRGCIIPFLRHATKAPKSASKDEVMRLALIAIAQKIGVKFKDWDNIPTDDIATVTRRHIQRLIAEKLESLSPEEKAKVLGLAQNNLKESAKLMGVPLVGAGAVVAGELSGFGVYLATTTGLKALSLALGTTFSWGVYQGATTVLGIILGPVGWAIAGLGLVGSAAVVVRNWWKGKGEQKLTLTVIASLVAIGESPFEFFSLSSEAPFEEVKRVYRAMMKTFHPDKLEKNLPQWVYDDFNEKLLRCQEAYEHLQLILGQDKLSNGDSP